ncbi:MAG: energy-coupling factor transporter ATPase [Clostridia bacterium]|nr:energy-coupling factor transporter ATPase [Clostridia bacterium]
MAEAIISIRDVCFQYDGAEKPAVDHVSLEIQKGEFIAVLGRNGSGKSTLAKLLNALLLPTSGEVVVDGVQAKGEDDALPVRERCGMVFQNPDNQIVATIVEEDCAFGLENMGVPSEEIRRRVDETLRAVGMEMYAESSPNMLSGGQKQRVAVAGVLAMRPKIIVFDESTAMLDPVGRRDVLSLAKRLNREEGITIVWITHFMNEAVQADRVAVMADGRLEMLGTPQKVFADTKRIEALGLEAPEMLAFGAALMRRGVKGLPQGVMTVEEMAEALWRLKSRA